MLETLSKVNLLLHEHSSIQSVRLTGVPDLLYDVHIWPSEKLRLTSPSPGRLAAKSAMRTVHRGPLGDRSTIYGTSVHAHRCHSEVS